MKLDDLSLGDLKVLQRRLDCLYDAGLRLEMGGFEVGFSLQPGHPVLTLEPLFEAERVRAYELPPEKELPEFTKSQPDVRPESTVIAVPEPLEEFPAMPGEDDYADPVLVEDFDASAEEDLLPAPEMEIETPTVKAADQAILSSRGDLVSDGGYAGGNATGPSDRRHGAGVGRAEPVPAPLEPAAPSMATVGKRPPRWTAEDDARLVDLVVPVRLSGDVPAAAWTRIAALLHRPLEGTKYRARTELSQRIALAMVEARKPKRLASPPAAPQAVAPKAPNAPVVSALVPPHAMGPQVFAVPSSPTLVVQHLAALPTRGGWTLARDLELVEMVCDRVDNAVICDALAVDAKALRLRLDLLTGTYLDADDKPVRRFTRDQVLAAMRQTAPKAQAAE